MASAISNNSLSFSLCPPSTHSPSKSTTASKTLAFSVHRYPRTKSLRVTEADPKAINGNENKAERKDLPSMKMLLHAYKKAILDGDEKRVSEIETAICVIAYEKTSLSLQFGQLTTEIASGRKNIVRLKADFENYRNRIEKDHLNLTSDVCGDVIESLLPVVDNFEKAKQYFNPETEKERKINTSYQGIYKQFAELMRSLGVAVIGTVGKPFDPSIHEAIAREESHRFRKGVVTEEIRRGFTLGERVLRMASVKVSIGPGPM